MVKRAFWHFAIEKAWARRSLIWLCGVRRSGKTFLCQSLDNIEYFDCELPRVRRTMEDPEEFFPRLKGKRIVLDEVHRLPNPSEFLKIATDHFPSVRVIATGFSILEASARFRDKLTGRKEQIWLTPMNERDLADFGRKDLSFRFLRGGLPPFFLDSSFPEKEFQEWIDSYWAKDIQDLFRLERRFSFVRFIELLFAQSSGIFEATRFAAPCEISRASVSNYLSVLEATKVVHVIRPFSSRKQSEIISAPKTYAFDTGFVCYFKGWDHLRQEDSGLLWEHYVLNEMHGRIPPQNIRYWRDKRGREIDFILARHGAPPAVVECKWKADAFDPTNLTAFRKFYPNGANWAVCSDVDRSYARVFNGLKVNFCGLKEWAASLESN